MDEIKMILYFLAAIALVIALLLLFGALKSCPAGQDKICYAVDCFCVEVNKSWELV